MTFFITPREQMEQTTYWTNITTFIVQLKSRNYSSNWRLLQQKWIQKIRQLPFNSLSNKMLNIYFNFHFLMEHNPDNLEQ
ncbi:CLUMA_CG011699, isoform A [Clunio marinus]|uniref:CLUMA_CG011699, isoform A n=1 Tax=Clunio marinus TaxID=568069 RepID=A0A1J1IIQ6_9DIPT|nr:CLUMA_CG011699, isoform A [Clunio marinus]